MTHDSTSTRIPFSCFLIPDGNARVAFLHHAAAVMRKAGPLSREDFHTVAEQAMRTPGPYVDAVMREYRRGAFAFSFLVEELARRAVGDFIVCIYNEINRSDRAYFEIFDKTIRGAGQTCFRMLTARGIDCRAAGADAGDWVSKLDSIELLTEPPAAGRSRAIFLFGLSSRPREALRVAEAGGASTASVARVVDPRLELFARPCDAFLRSTHVRVSEMYSHVFANAPMGFTFPPVTYLCPRSLASALIQTHESDCGRRDDAYDIYEPAAYEELAMVMAGRCPSAGLEVNAVLGRKRRMPLLAAIARRPVAALDEQIDACEAEFGTSPRCAGIDS